MIIALIDDHPLLTQTLQSMFLKQTAVSKIYTYRSAGLFLESLKSTEPDIALLDILMPDMNGIQLLESLKGSGIKTKFIILTSNSDAPVIKQALDNGAFGFLSKGSLFEEIMVAIEKVMAGEQYIATDLKDLLLKSLLLSDADFKTRLTPREKDVLTRVCTGHTLKQIAEELTLSMNTVQYYHKNVMAKLKVKKTADMVVEAIRKGLFIPANTVR